MEVGARSIHGTVNIGAVCCGPRGTQSETPLLTAANLATPLIQEVLAIENYGCTRGIINRVHSSSASALPEELRHGERANDSGQADIFRLCYGPKTNHPTTKCSLITDEDKLIRVRQANFLNVLKNRGCGSWNGSPPAQEHTDPQSRGGYQCGWTGRGGKKNCSIRSIQKGRGGHLPLPS